MFQMNVRRQVVGVGDDISDMFFGLDSELLHGGVNLPEVVDAGGGLGFGAGAKQIGDHNRRQQRDDGDHNHDFHQRESSQTFWPGSFHSLFLVSDAA